MTASGPKAAFVLGPCHVAEVPETDMGAQVSKRMMNECWTIIGPLSPGFVHL
jgi:hypothetical protein